MKITTCTYVYPSVQHFICLAPWLEAYSHQNRILKEFGGPSRYHTL